MQKFQVLMARGVAFVVASSAAVAMATPTFTITQPSFDYAQLGTYFGVILAALAALWLGRKFIKTTNRS
jgi:hypothetical protein